MQRRRPLFTLDVDAGAVLEQQPHHRLVPVLGRLMQRRPPLFILDVDAGAVLEQQPHPRLVPAHRGAVLPYSSWTSTPAPFSSSSRTTASCPLSATSCSAVHPYLPWTSTPAPFSSSSRTTASCPPAAARSSAVHPFS